MTARLPPVGFEEVARVLHKAGFEQAGQKGSHVKFRRPDGRTVIVPRHRELARGTLASVLRQAALSPEEFRRAL
ncbi:MAG TPA: type II toxin-antitoxin system HicA family toxin [Actinomycetota bacterium]|nr:type II toxin-antitoxin system HicA family toxin [Actinomycetota bacterium]